VPLSSGEGLGKGKLGRHVTECRLGPRPTSVPSGILIHPEGWPQQTWAKIGGYTPFWGELGTYLTHCDLQAYLHAKLHLDPSNSLAATHKRYRQDRQTDNGLIAYGREKQFALLSDRCPVCPGCDLVYCGQTVGWLKMKLGMVVGLVPSNLVLDDDDDDEGIGRARHKYPQARCRSAKQVGLQMSSERQRGKSCCSQSGW